MKSNEMKTFALSETVVANMTAQGIVEGTSYTVIKVVALELTAGTYFDYVLEDANGVALPVRNGHIILDHATTKAN
jgi:hypothetical protein